MFVSSITFRLVCFFPSRVHYISDSSLPGTRGATSAEYLLSQGYAVIFLHRQFSQQPFLRHYSHSTNPFLDLLDIEEGADSSATTDPSGEGAKVVVNAPPEALPLLKAVLRQAKLVKTLGTLHTVTFVTVDDYLFLLRAISGSLKDAGVGREALYFLAAAVSDFFLPRQRMVCLTPSRI